MKGRTLTVGALHRGVEEEDGLVDDTTNGAPCADETAHNASGAAGDKGHNSIRGSAATLHQTTVAKEL